MTTSAENEWPRQVAILGVGLLGGSVALALRRALPQTRLVGFARSPEKRQYLSEQGIIDLPVATLPEACQQSDVVVVAAPVDRIAEMVVSAAESSPPDCLITDVGSTKYRIVSAVAEHPDAAKKFVPAHPIAGSEKSGPAHATDSLFDEKLVVLTPTETTEPKLLEKAHRFWRLTGGQTCEMTPSEHDTHLAAISHMPHLVSALVAKMAASEALPLAGTGWRDITRVAIGDPTLWTAICSENRTAIGGELERLADELGRLRQLLQDADDDALHRWLSKAKEIRELSP
jgi:prephenate dehydrogenase